MHQSSVLLLLLGGALAGCATGVKPGDAGLDDASVSDAAPDGGDGGLSPADAGSPDAGPATPPCSVGSSTDPLVVATTRGLVRGKRAGDTRAFLGIPFAKPPVGRLRFAPPEAAACWTGEQDATDYGGECPQPDLAGTSVKGKEDCLTLNLWTPAAAGAGLPVLVFMHGGANMIGLSNQSVVGNLYDGEPLSTSQQVVVVTFNYRLGALGFLSHPALAQTSPTRASGNYGLMDALLALAWVQDNVGAFGGDTSRVMLFGESAGAFDTCALVGSPLARGLFANALMESGACSALTAQQSAATGAEVASKVHCASASDVAACLRAAPVSELVAAGGSLTDFLGRLTGPAPAEPMPFMASVDGYVLEDTPLRTLQQARHNPVGLIIGTNATEAALFLTSASVRVNTCAELRARVAVNFPGRADDLLQLYPCNLLDPNATYGQLASDYFFHCPARRALRAASAAHLGPVYRYYFTHGFDYGTLALLGPTHAMELPFVFHSFLALGYVPTPGEVALSDTMQAYWARFAAAGNPNAAARPYWEAYAPSRDNTIVLDTPVSAQDGVSSRRCDAWDAL